MAASSGAIADDSGRGSSSQRASSASSTGNNAHASRAPTMPIRTPPFTPLARLAESVSATKAAGSDSQRCPVSRTMTTYVVMPGSR